MSLFDGPDVGDVLRLRNFRRYSLDGQSWVDWSCTRRGEKKADKKVFVAVLVGMEPLVMKKGADDSVVREGLRGCGYVHIDEAVKAGADPEPLGFEPMKKVKAKRPPAIHKSATGKRTVCGREVTHTTRTTRKNKDVTCKQCLRQLTPRG